MKIQVEGRNPCRLPHLTTGMQATLLPYVLWAQQLRVALALPRRTWGQLAAAYQCEHTQKNLTNLNKT